MSAQPFQPLASIAPGAASAQPVGKDPLSEVLRTVKLTGALFFLVDATSPWGVEVPHAHVFGPIILPRSQHVVSYHIVLQGTGYAHLPDIAPARFAAEQILGGVGVGGALLAASWIAATRMPETALNRWHSSLFPLEGTSLLTISGIRLTELAIGWTAAALLAWLAARWRLSWRQAGLGLAAAAMWAIAPALVMVLRGPWPPVPISSSRL